MSCPTSRSTLTIAENRYPRRGKAQLTYNTIASTGGTTTLTEDQAQAEVLKLTGATATAEIIQYPWTPKDAGMQVWVVNAQTSGGSTSCTFKAYTADGGTTPTTGVTITQGKNALLYYDGAEFVVFYQGT